MICLDDLIKEGRGFSVKRQGMTEYIECGMMVINKPFKYIDRADEFMAWQEKSKRFIQINYPGDRALKDFIDVCQSEINDQTIFKLVAILEALKVLPAICTMDKKEASTNINVVQNQTQHQKQKQSQSLDIFYEALKDNLTMRQYEEIQQIIKEAPNKEDAEPKIKEKLRGFGESVLVNVVSNILTNPSVWSGFCG